MADLHDLGVAELARKLRSREVSAVEAAQHFMARIRVHEALGAFLATDPAITRAQAEAADRRLAAGDAAPLLGVPIAHKDIFVTRDFASTAGWRIIEGYSTPIHPTLVARLAESRWG
jgi:aspartyl-tRNA(Asn)/glutamyl-tRNA(Gln) amidotransferase subunit A